MNLHNQCFIARVPNYLSLSLVIAHLVRLTLVNTRIKTAQLRDAMRELRFEEIMMGYGFFFLHDMDLKKLTLRHIPKDPSHLVDLYGKHYRTKKNQPPPAQLALIQSAATAQHPWGAFLKKERLVELVKTVPNQMMKDQEVLIHTQLRHPDTAPMFMAFSAQIWLLISNSFQAIPEQTPATLQEAIEIWTLHNFQKMFDLVDFHPTHDGLEGIANPSANETFGDRRKFFFLKKNEASSSPLEQFCAIPNLYLSQYQTVLETQTPQKVNDLHHDLDLIFSLLQCLPLSMKERKRDVVFKLSNGRLQTILNARYYRIKGIFLQGRMITNSRAQVPGVTLLKKLLRARCAIFCHFYSASSNTTI